MGLLDKMIDTAAKKVLIDAAGEAISKTAGAVEEVSITGKTNFRKGQKYPADVCAVITYHDFR